MVSRIYQSKSLLLLFEETLKTYHPVVSLAMFASKEKRALWRRRSPLDIEAPTSQGSDEGETGKGLGDGSVPWQIFHEPQPEETIELI